MFEQAVLSNGPASKRVWTTFAGVTGQALLVTFAVMIPMIWPEAMPSHQTFLKIFVPTAPPAPPRGAVSNSPVARTMPKTFRVTGLTIPTSMPPRAEILVDPLPPPGESDAGTPGVVGGLRNGVPGGLADLFHSLTAPVSPPKPMEHRAPAAAPVEAAAPVRVRVGGLVVLGEPVRRVEPRYPPIAITARISGVVELEGVVGVDGRIRELAVKRGHPILTPAALDAVRQWIYRPTTLNGEPVEVIAPITVTFRLN